MPRQLRQDLRLPEMLREFLLCIRNEYSRIPPIPECISMYLLSSDLPRARLTQTRNNSQGLRIRKRRLRLADANNGSRE